ncbi:hypothetical protein MMC18_005656 [Xylographa bjoerkii]|nr:hypothetical protein [Xylographa bjoerkii]
MSQLINPYIAQLPANYNTGLIKEFAPRINSSLTYEEIEPSEFPFDCNKTSSAFYAYYSSADFSTTESFESWNVEACVPNNKTESSLKATRGRQDVSEELYLNITFSAPKTPERSTATFTASQIIVKNYS